MVATERDVVLNERRDRVERKPDAILNEALLRILYLNHPYGRPIIGWNHEILDLDRQTALEFYRRYYTPNERRAGRRGRRDAGGGAPPRREHLRQDHSAARGGARAASLRAPRGRARAR